MVNTEKKTFWQHEEKKQEQISNFRFTFVIGFGAAGVRKKNMINVHFFFQDTDFFPDNLSLSEL